MPDEYTLKFKVEVTIDPTEWADEYVRYQPIEDARSYIPELLESGLDPQKDWGVVTHVAITNIGDSE